MGGKARIHQVRSGDLQVHQIEKLASALAKTFDRDMHFNWLVRQDEHRQDALISLFRLLLGKYAADGGVIQFTPDDRGIAIWFPPGHGRMSLLKQLSFLHSYLPIAGWSGFAAKVFGLHRMERHRPRQPHYYLSVIGVDPDAQGQGYGRSLMTLFLQACDENRQLAYLETSNPNNSGFYERMGFENMGSYPLPGGPMLMRLMRTPQ